jgi:hypothetical protein
MLLPVQVRVDGYHELGLSMQAAATADPDGYGRGAPRRQDGGGSGDYYFHPKTLVGQAVASKLGVLSQLDIIVRGVTSSDLPNSSSSQEYDRQLYDHQTGADRLRADTEDDQLLSHSRVRPRMPDDRRDVLAGESFDAYTGHTFSRPRDPYVDDIVPRAEAPHNGPHRWPAGKRCAYANDLSDTPSQIMVSAGANLSSGVDARSYWMAEVRQCRPICLRHFVAVARPQEPHTGPSGPACCRSGARDLSKSWALVPFIR